MSRIRNTFLSVSLIKAARNSISLSVLKFSSTIIQRVLPCLVTAAVMDSFLRFPAADVGVAEHGLVPPVDFAAFGFGLGGKQGNVRQTMP